MTPLPPLNARTVYISPLGHRCRWVQLERTAVNLYFEYLDVRTGRHVSNGFTLRRCNMRMLKIAEGERA